MLKVIQGCPVPQQEPPLCLRKKKADIRDRGYLYKQGLFFRTTAVYPENLGQLLSKPVRNMPEPTKLLGMLIKSIAEKYGLSDCKNEEQPDAAESEEDYGK